MLRTHCSGLFSSPAWGVPLVSFLLLTPDLSRIRLLLGGRGFSKSGVNSTMGYSSAVNILEFQRVFNWRVLSETKRMPAIWTFLGTRVGGI